MFMTSSSNRESIQIQPLILIDKKNNNQKTMKFKAFYIYKHSAYVVRI